MLFKDVVGQGSAKEGLLKMLHNNLMPHAIMILGAEGTGGLSLGLALAQYIFCENRGEFDSCGKCPSCNKAAKLEHADFHLSFPAIKPKPDIKAMSKHYIREFREFVKQTPYGTTFDWLQHIDAENKQGNITAEECRDIIDILNLMSYEGGNKVMLMWRPEYLHKEGNILLKLIEEPPPKTFLIFVAQDSGDILPTIKSRTQAVRLAPIPASEIEEAVITRSHAEPFIAKKIAHIANGNYNEALRLLRSTNNDLFPAVRSLFHAIFSNKGSGDGVNIVKFVDEWSKHGREQQKNLLNYIVHLLEHSVRARFLTNIPIPLPDEETKLVQYIANNQTITFQGLRLMAETISQTMHFIERNAHPKTQLLAMAIKLHYIVRNKDIPV